MVIYQFIIYSAMNVVFPFVAFESKESQEKKAHHYRTHDLLSVVTMNVNIGFSCKLLILLGILTNQVSVDLGVFGNAWLWSLLCVFNVLYYL